MTRGEPVIVDSTMRALIAGYGSIGRRHLANLRRLFPFARIALLRSGAGGQSASPPAGADEVFYDLEQAAAYGPDVALVCNPSSHHLPVARRLLASGAHLFVEKPLADDLEGVEELLGQCAAAGRTLMVGYNLVFLPSLEFVKDFLSQGRVGRVLSVRAEVGQYLPDWRPGSDYRAGASARRELGGGALLELSHELHYLHWLFGDVERVQAAVIRSGELEIDVEDLVEMLLHFQGGVLASVHLDFLQRTYARSCKIIGSTGTLVWEASEQRVRFHSPGDRQGQILFEDREADRNDTYIRELEHFLDCVAGRTHPRVDGAAGRSVLRVIAAARRSAQTGTAIEP
jgi:predicted dehydrogenase